MEDLMAKHIDWLVVVPMVRMWLVFLLIAGTFLYRSTPSSVGQRARQRLSPPNKKAAGADLGFGGRAPHGRSGRIF